MGCDEFKISDEGRKASDNHNEIEEVCKQIEQTISRTLQTALHNFDKDVNSVLEAISKRLAENEKISDRNRTCLLFTSFTMVVCFGIIFSTGLHYLVESNGVEVVSSTFHVQKELIQALTVPAKLMLSFFGTENESSHLYIGFSVLIVSMVYLICCRIFLKPTIPRRDVRELLRLRNFVLNDLMIKKTKLIEEYIGDSCEL